MARGEGAAATRALALRSFLLLEHAVLFVVACRTLKIFRARGVRGVYSATFKALRNLPGVEAVIQAVLSREVRGAVRRLSKSDSQVAREAAEARRPILRLPLEGVPPDELLKQLELLKRQEEAHFTSSSSGSSGGGRGGSGGGGGGLMSSRRSLGYAHTQDVGGGGHCAALLGAFKAFCEGSGAGPAAPELDRVLEVAFQAFVMESGVNPTNPALVPWAVRKCENEVLAMAASLFKGDEEAVGSLTSGTQESILLAVKTYRDRHQKLHPEAPEPLEMVIPVTAHPSFVKAAHLFGVRAVLVPVGPDSRVSLSAVEAAITPSTFLLVGSAPQYPHGVIDPIPQLADLAMEHGVPLHVDACFGGFLLPFLEQLGQVLTPWDFRVPGVASISADLHKYGWALKGTSVLLYRSPDVRQYQWFTYLDWPGGVFGSPSLVGTRPGGNVAASWVAMMSLGESGYLRLAKACLDVTQQLKEGVRAISGLGLVAEPEFVSLAILSRDARVDILLVGDAMEERGWWMERQQSPASLHLSVMPHHAGAVADRFLLDLRACVDNVRRKGGRAVARKGKAAIYQVVEALPDRTLTEDFIKRFYQETHRLSPTEQLIMSGSSHNLVSLDEGDEEEEEEEGGSP